MPWILHPSSRTARYTELFNLQLTEERLGKKLNKKNNKGCLSGILGTLLVVAGVILYAVISSLINNLLISMRFGDKTACALLSLSISGIGVAFVLYEVIFVAWQVKLGKTGSDGEAKFNKLFKLIAIACVCASLLFAIVSASTYTKLSDTSVSKVFFIEYESYDIEEDVARCTLSCDSSGRLSYVITMKDNEKFELLGTVNSCGSGFVEKYENLYGYAAYISEGLLSRGLPTRIVGEKYMEEGYKDSHPEVWKYLEKIISMSE